MYFVLSLTTYAWFAVLVSSIWACFLCFLPSRFSKNQSYVKALFVFIFISSVVLTFIEFLISCSFTIGLGWGLAISFAVYIIFESFLKLKFNFLLTCLCDRLAIFFDLDKVGLYKRRFPNIGVIYFAHGALAKTIFKKAFYNYYLFNYNDKAFTSVKFAFLGGWIVPFNVERQFSRSIKLKIKEFSNKEPFKIYSLCELGNTPFVIADSN